MGRFETNNMLIYSHGLLYNFSLINTLFSPTCSVALHAHLFDTVNGKYQKSKEIATDSNYLKCHALLTALHFPLETTSYRRIIILK